MITLGVHALGVADVITLLPDIARSIGSAGSHQPARQQSAPSANRSPACAAESASRCRTEAGTDERGGQSAPHRGPVWSLSLNLLGGILPAEGVVFTKLIEVFPRARQCHHAGAIRNGGA